MQEMFSSWILCQAKSDLILVDFQSSSKLTCDWCGRHDRAAAIAVCRLLKMVELIGNSEEPP